MNENGEKIKYRGLGSVAVDCIEVMTDIGLVHVDTYDLVEAKRLHALELEEATRKSLADQNA